ncbi:UDP-2,3-diacylglucosamine diphosphatase [Azotobacter beijerinckii]|uniref:UDP-2,3-diacylglucosamine hydrolase n=1 Tax=Azotobacter beijerinckii TaxID=170623 RepID=A0A1I4E8Q8_9GAMM|nr:UDP-2,3-diacylglucosamine diphosphatase [Azotobacter beijerinckii]SFB47239.1 UDP-2,3-diacylglucosamine hydrolase [Azotobacter beijerinckii]SFL02204.1 UDP-2,3-diacylglucosamine hydrolase [Azotobacter beijerinckii]
MATLLISDLHLDEERPDISRAFLRFLKERASQAEALYILGDFFEVWIGDDAMSPFQCSIAKALRDVADRGTRIFFMHGNRDFLVGRSFCRQAGCSLLRDPSRIELNGAPVLLMHGDTLCTRDIAYMRFRRRLRNPLSTWLLRHLPLSKRQQLARKWRDASRQQVRQKAAEIVDVTPEEIPRIMAEHGVLTLIHGHTHRPAVHVLQVNGRDARRIVLGDWNRQGWVLEIDDRGYHLDAFPIH